MKFLEMVEDLQKRENKIILVKCGIFFMAIGRDAVLLLEKNLGCRNCKNYQKQCQYENIYIFDILEERKKEQNNESKEG